MVNVTRMARRTIAGIAGLWRRDRLAAELDAELRIALGAQRPQVLWLLLRRSLFWIGTGIALGVPLALAAARGAATLVFGVNPMDPATLLGAALVMVVMGTVAALIPSRRALNVDPLAALRVE